ncbi:delta-stichotoxin-Sgt2a-like [Tubulanus polymorphus]|uniref:delta-stichotoxin-Sgt2a-like n=1 Tax=Tubulanus polymorphus TaxID=672921 RepID=UPI003DA3FB06
MYKTLFVALAVFMVLGAVTAEETEVHIARRGVPCFCPGRFGLGQGTYWLIGGPSSNCCSWGIGKCCKN